MNDEFDDDDTGIIMPTSPLMSGKLRRERRITGLIMLTRGIIMPSRL